MRHGCESFGAAIEETIDLDGRLQVNALFEQGLEPTSEHSSCETRFSSPKLVMSSATWKLHPLTGLGRVVSSALYIAGAGGDRLWLGEW
jgi:hypothetical protein